MARVTLSRMSTTGTGRARERRNVRSATPRSLWMESPDAALKAIDVLELEKNTCIQVDCEVIWR